VLALLRALALGKVDDCCQYGAPAVVADRTEADLDRKFAAIPAPSSEIPPYSDRPRLGLLPLDLLHVGQSIRHQHLDVSVQQFELLVAEQSLRAGIDELDIALLIDHDDAGGHAVEKDARVLFLRPGAVHHCVHDGNGSQIDETEEDEQEQLDEFAILELEAK